MKRVSFALAVLIIAGLAVGLAGCAPQEKPQPIKVGLLTIESGSAENAAIGKAIRNAVEMGIQEINDAGGVEISEKKYPLQLIVADSENSEAGAVAGAQKLITQDGVIALLNANTSRVAIPASWVGENSKTVNIGTSVTSPDLTVDPVTGQPKKYVFRTTYNNDFQGAALAQIALTRMGAKTAAILYNSDEDFNRSVAEGFKQAFEEGPGDVNVVVISGEVPVGTESSEGQVGAPGAMWFGKVVASETYKTGDTDFTAQLKRIKEANPDVLLLPNYFYDVPAQAKQARELGIKAQLLGPDSWAQAQMLEACGSNCEGGYFTTDFMPQIPNPEAEKFIADYKAKYGFEPESNPALAYDSVKVLASALQRAAKVDREALREGMAGLPKYAGVTGDIQFRPGSGDPIKAANIMQIKDGKFVYFGDVNP